MTTNPPPLEPRIYFACFTDPVDPSLTEVTPRIPAHKEWLAEQDRAGTLFAAGPFLSDSLDYTGRGLMIIRAPSLEAATRIAASDPMHMAGVRTFRILTWRINEGTIDLKLPFATATFA